jgi:hypothetical protein
MDNTTEPKYGENSALRIEPFKIQFAENTDLSKIPFDLSNLDLIDGYIWSPVEEDKLHMSQLAFDEAIDLAKKRREKLLFSNTFVNYDSCDCGGDYPCDHGDFPYEIEVKNSSGEIITVIEIDGDALDFQSIDCSINIVGLKNFTYADFARFCKLCGITLESKYIQ